MPRARDLAAGGLAAVALWVGLGSYGLVEPSDARYAEIAREMWASGDWLFPRLLGIHHFHKPPLVYWVTALGYGVAGPTEWGARLGQGVLATLLVLVLWRFARRHLAPGAATWAALFAATTPAVVGAERMVTTDLLLCLCQTVALTAAYEIWNGSAGRGERIALYLALGAAFLTKGPVGWIVPLLVLLAFLPFHRRGATEQARWGLAWGVPLALAVALPWYAYAVGAVPGLLDYFLGGQIASRLKEGGMGHPHPWHYYLYVFPALGLPWALLAPAGRRAAARASEPLAWFLGAWALVPPIFFSLPATKLPLYVLAAYPAMALLAAQALAAAADEVRALLRAVGFGFVLAAAAALVVGLGVVPLRGGDLAAMDRAALGTVFLPIAAVLAAAGAGAAAWTADRGSRPDLAALCIAAGLALTVGWAFSRGDALPLRTARPTARKALEHLGPDAVLAEYGSLSAGFAFYTGRIPVLGGISRETLFEGPEVERRVLSREAFLDLWKGPRRVVALTRPKYRKDLPGGRDLARGNGYVLVENR
ncbi:ArnT family glycosyltransferase [Deferrisoma palaeochoriense]